MGLLGFACEPRASPGGRSSSRSSHADPPGRVRQRGRSRRKRRTQRHHPEWM